MNMAFWLKYGDFILDICLYVGIAVLLVLASRWIWKAREEKRNRKAAEDYYLRKEEEKF